MFRVPCARSIRLLLFAHAHQQPQSPVWDLLELRRCEGVHLAFSTPMFYACCTAKLQGHTCLPNISMVGLFFHACASSMGMIQAG